MQKQLLIILLSVLTAFSASAQSLQSADSLYKAKQFTQAFEQFRLIYQNGRYSPAMLLKMAHIQEGLGHLGESLYYLNLYSLATHDVSVLKKMEELAQKNNLKGYETTDNTRFLAWLQTYRTETSLALAALACFLLGVIWFEHTKKKTRPVASAVMLGAVLLTLFAHNNFFRPIPRGIIALPKTYLMSGPSSGSSVVAIIDEGHQLPIKGKTDVWLKVNWDNAEVYVKAGRIRTVEL